MRRGDIHIAAARGAYTENPRRVVIVQDDRFDATASLTVCPLTTNPIELPLARITLEASDASEVAPPGRIMVDKITTMPRANVRDRLGRLSDADVVRLNRALAVFLGIAG